MDSDACRVGIRAILIQNNRPVAYYSESIKGSSLTLSTYKREMLAIVKAIQKWQLYLLGKLFVIWIDYLSLKYLLGNWRVYTPTIYVTKKYTMEQLNNRKRNN